PAQIRVVWMEVRGGLGLEQAPIGVSDGEVGRTGDPRGDLGLHREYAREHRVVLVGPQLGPVGNADQRGAHAHRTRTAPRLLPADGAFEEVLGAKLPTELLRLLRRPLVLSAALPGDDAQ